MTLFCALVELPLDGLVVPLFFKSDHTRHLIHLVLFGTCLSTLVWVLGDLWLVGKGQHVLDDACLHLRVGASPLDKPNAVLILDPYSFVRLTHMGVERTGLACVFLYLNSPQALASKLRHPPGMDSHT